MPYPFSSTFVVLPGFWDTKQAEGIRHKAFCCFAFWQPCLDLYSLIQTTVASDLGRLCVQLAFCSVGTGITCTGGRAAHHLLPSHASAKNEWSCTFIPTYALVACIGKTLRLTITLTTRRGVVITVKSGVKKFVSRI